jgi:cyclohexanone monooxygenase
MTHDAYESTDVAIVGAGFAGLYAIHKLRGLGLTAQVFEKGSDVGGTWFWNRYPGARCDVEDTEYSYAFDEELLRDWEWTERYPSQPELQRYLRHVVDRFDLAKDIRLNTTVTSAYFDESINRWTVTVDDGDPISARFLIMATGPLSVPKDITFEGLEDFRGAIYRTSTWPEEPVDFAGQRVGVIGTGSSGAQLIPQVAKQADELVVFQRTANYTVPARNSPVDQLHQAWIRENTAEYRARRRTGLTDGAGTTSALSDTPESRAAEFRSRWHRGGTGYMTAYTDIMVDPEANEAAAQTVRDMIAEIVTDKDTAKSLTPVGFPLGSKRLCVVDDYYETFNLDSVSLVDLKKTPLKRVTAHGIETDTAHHDLDSLILATGFEAMVGALLHIDLRGRDNRSIADAWSNGPHTYLGMMTEGFPNMFIIAGPGSPSVLSNVVTSIEQHVDWIADCIVHLQSAGAAAIEADREAQQEWVQHVEHIANMTLFPKAPSWYGALNKSGEPVGFMPYAAGPGPYADKCDAVAASGYDGFIITF